MRRVTKDRFTSRSKEVKRFLDDLPGNMAQKFKEVTPIRTGNAKSKTSLEGKNKIIADYPYAGRLERDGWSRQAPDGMSEPTIDHARDLLRRLK